MRLYNLPSDFSPFFMRKDKEGRLGVPNNIKIVVGTESFNCSGCILAERSPVLQKLEF